MCMTKGVKSASFLSNNKMSGPVGVQAGTFASSRLFGTFPGLLQRRTSGDPSGGSMTSWVVDK